ncbi:hypothetical protein [Streptacidiphilus sp. EB103A]|uniref:hypothetical protein n=1 Tax=Streptacidiphilus sp. EB103A TaxID=3156275 RepID=UPI00351649B1
MVIVTDGMLWQADSMRATDLYGIQDMARTLREKDQVRQERRKVQVSTLIELELPMIKGTWRGE